MKSKVFKVVFGILGAIAILFFALYSLVFGFNYYESDTDCINSCVMFNDISVDSYIYKYENKHEEFFIVRDTNGDLWTGRLKTIKIGNKSWYKFFTMRSGSLTYKYPDWQKDGNFKYIFLQDKSDIEKYDCGNETPVCTQLDFIDSKGEYVTGYLFLLDLW